MRPTINRFRSCAVLIPFALLLALPAAGGASTAPYNSATGGSPAGTPQCGSVSGADLSAPIAPSQVEVLKVRGISCGPARQVVKRCITTSSVAGWKASRANFTSRLTSGKKVIQVRFVTGPAPACLEPKVLQKARTRGEFGPFEFPQSYPSKWPAPYTVAYNWSSRADTYSATIPADSVSSVTLTGYGENRDGAMRAFWFQYGKTRDLGSETEKQNPPSPGTDAPIGFTAELLHLKAKTRFFWRAAATIDGADGKIETVYGTMGTFVTNPYPTIKNSARPCDSAVGGSGTVFELTESLAIVCNVPTPITFSKGACFPACSSFYNGTIRCPKQFARDLNAGSWSIPIPKVGISVSVNNLVSAWRSNDSNRFITWLPGKNANSPGGAVGPIPGWSDWDVAQWAYPFTPTSTEAEFWIYCTEQFGDVINTDALAAGEGSDSPSTTAPSAPVNLTVRKAPDGGIDASWGAPGSASPSGVAGYYLTVTAWKTGQPRVFADNNLTPVTTTATSGHIAPGQVEVLKKMVPAGYQSVVAVAAVSREGSVSAPATVPLP